MVRVGAKFVGSGGSGCLGVGVNQSLVEVLGLGHEDDLVYEFTGMVLDQLSHRHPAHG